MKKEFKVKINLTKKDFKYLKNIKFKYDKVSIDTDEYNPIAEKMVNIGIFEYIVTSWGYEEHEFYLSDIGEQIYKEILNYEIN